MKKREAQFQTQTLNHWLRHVYKKTCAFETKYATADRITFSRLEPHQRSALLATKHGQLVYKISDESIGSKPFDGFCMAGEDAFVIIKYHTDINFYLIDIDDWCEEEKKSKSLKLERAKEIAKIISYKICEQCGGQMAMHKRRFCSDKCQRQNKKPL